MHQFFYNQENGLLICRQGFRKLFYQLTRNYLQSSSSIWTSGIYVLGSIAPNDFDDFINQVEEPFNVENLVANITSNLPEFPSSIEDLIPEDYKLPVHLNMTELSEQFDLISEQNLDFENDIVNLETNITSQLANEISYLEQQFDQNVQNLEDQINQNFINLENGFENDVQNIQNEMIGNFESLQNQINGLQGALGDLTNLVQSIPSMVQDLLEASPLTTSEPYETTQNVTLDYFTTSTRDPSLEWQKYRVGYQNT